jgi:hypothetical protein
MASGETVKSLYLKEVEPRLATRIFIRGRSDRLGRRRLVAF